MIVETDDFTVDLAAKKVNRDGARRPADAHRVAPAGGAGPQHRPAGQPEAAAPGGLGARRTARRPTTCGSTWPSCGASWRRTPRTRGTSSPSRAWATASRGECGAPVRSPVSPGTASRMSAVPRSEPGRRAGSAGCSTGSPPPRRTCSPRSCSEDADSRGLHADLRLPRPPDSHGYWYPAHGHAAAAGRRPGPGGRAVRRLGRAGRGVARAGARIVGHRAGPQA